MSAPEDSDPGVAPASDWDRVADVTGTAGAAAVPVALLETACERLRIERRLLTDERCAFEQFADRLVGIDGTVSTATIESHYRETVMAVPHYHAEYRDTYPESVAAEFGRTVAAGLQRRNRVDPATVDAIRGAARRCRTRRDRVVDLIDAERHAVRAAHEEVDAMREALATIGGAGPAGVTDGLTVRSRCRLRLLLARCDDLACRRREQLGLDAGSTTGAEGVTGAEGTTGAGATTDAEDATGSAGAVGSSGSDDPEADATPDRVVADPTADGLQPGRLQSLCYGELDTERPVLAVLAALRRSIADRRRRSYCPLED